MTATIAGEGAVRPPASAPSPARYQPPTDRGQDGDAIYGRRPVTPPPAGWWPHKEMTPC